MKNLKFEVVTIRPTKVDDAKGEQFSPDGYEITDRLFWRYIALAYLPEVFATQDRLQNIPAWAMTEPYDMVGKVAPEDMAEWQRQTKDKLDNSGLKSVLQAALAERCKLRVHLASVKIPGYDLVLGKHGAKLKQTPPDEVFPSDASVAPDGTRSLITIEGDSTKIAFYNASMARFAASLSVLSRVQIQDTTGLTGRYDFVLNDARPVHSNDAVEVGPVNPSERWDIHSLGLTLARTDVQATTVVVEHVERPSPN